MCVRHICNKGDQWFFIKRKKFFGQFSDKIWNWKKIDFGQYWNFCKSTIFNNFCSYFCSFVLCKIAFVLLVVACVYAKPKPDYFTYSSPLVASPYSSAVVSRELHFFKIISNKIQKLEYEINCIHSKILFFSFKVNSMEILLHMWPPTHIPMEATQPIQHHT